MTYVLDTNVFIAGLNGIATVLRRLDALNPEDIVLCAPVLVRAPVVVLMRFSNPSSGASSDRLVV